MNRKLYMAIFYFLIPLTPAVIWSMQVPIRERFFNAAVTFASIGELLGLVGMSLFAVTLILSSRLKILDKMTGLNRVYINHHQIGSLSFMLLLLHPLFLAINYAAISPRAAALFFLPSMGDWSRTFGVIALLLMNIFLALTFYFALRYHIWKFTHRFLDVAFLFGFFHVLSIPSDVSTNLALRWYMISLCSIAIVLQVYHLFLKRLLAVHYEYIVKEVLLKGAITEITMEPVKKSLRYETGQFAFYKFYNKAVSTESHPFSFVSSPNEKYIKISAKSLGDYTAKINGITSGTRVVIDGPYGRFNFQNFAAKKQIWIAGGIGITPFLSMAKFVSQTDREADLYWGVNNQEEAIYLEELQTFASSHKQFRVFPIYNNVDGRITAEKVKQMSAGLEGKDILICGPPPMMRGLKQQFVKIMKIRSSLVHTEEFSL